MQMQPMAAYYPGNITTDHIQHYLDENKSLIRKIVESKNSANLSECAGYQARFQRNLIYLAAIADKQYSQSQAFLFNTLNTVTPTHPPLHQHQQTQSMIPQSLMPARSSMLYGPSLQQQALHSQLGMSSGVNTPGEPHSGSFGGGGFPDYVRGDGLYRGMGSGSQHDFGSGSGEGQGGEDGGEPFY